MKFRHRLTAVLLSLVVIFLYGVDVSATTTSPTTGGTSGTATGGATTATGSTSSSSTTATTGGTATSAGSNSNTFRQNFIALKKGQSLADIDTSTLTMEQLRVIALFISNFYAPYSTTMTADNEKTDERIVDALKNNCGFAEDTAKELVAQCKAQSLDTMKPLYFTQDTARSNTFSGSIQDGLVSHIMYEYTVAGDKDYESATREHFVSPAVAFAQHALDGNSTDTNTIVVDSEAGSTNLFSVMLKTDNVNILEPNDNGGIGKLPKDLFCFDVDESTELPTGTYRLTSGMLISMMKYVDTTEGKNGTYFFSDAPIIIYWQDDSGNFKQCMEVTNALAQSYMMVANELNYGGGVGSSFFTTDKDTYDKLNDEDKWKVMQPFSQLYIDWVGNILLFDGFEYQVFLPACMNPYAFKTKLGKHEGNILNLVSSYGISKVKSNKVEEKKKPENGGIGQCLQKISHGSTTLVHLKKWKMFRGGGGGDWKGDKISKYISNLPDFNKGNHWNLTRGSAESMFYPSFFDGLTNWKSENGENGLRGTGTNCMSGEDCNGGYLSYGRKAFDFSEYMWSDRLDSYLESPDDSIFQKESVFDIKSGGSSQVSLLSVTDLHSIAPLLPAEDQTRIYLTYLYAYANYQGEDTDLNMIFNGDNFPLTTNQLDLTDLLSAAAQADADMELKSMMYHLLSAEGGIEYFKKWIKNKMVGLFLGWHEDMVGGTHSNASTGATKYIGFEGYATLASLSDMSWTDWLLSHYNNLIVYMIVCIAIILFCYMLVGSMTGQQAIISGVLFGVFVFLPPVAINMAVDGVNGICDRIYGNRFMYWGIVQLQTYMQDSGASSEGDLNTQIKVEVEGTTDESYTQSQGYANVKLKWMSPKKDNYLATLLSALGQDTGQSESVLNLAAGMMSKVKSGEEFLDDPSALYLYRDYLDLTMYALKSYNQYAKFNANQKINIDVKKSDYNVIDLPESTKTMIRYETGETAAASADIKTLSSSFAVKRGFLYDTIGESEHYLRGANEKSNGETTLATGYLLSYAKPYKQISKTQRGLLYNANKGITQISKAQLYSYGLPQGCFNFTQSDLSSTEEMDADSVEYFFYTLYSESPFYFFTFNALDQMNAFCLASNGEVPYTTNIQTAAESSEPNFGGGSTGSFHKMLLDDKLGYFMNYSEKAGNGRGRLRDFMNMHDLFYYVMPLMKTGVDHFETFNKMFGAYMYDDVPIHLNRQDGTIVVDGVTLKIHHIDRTNTNPDSEGYYKPAFDLVEPSTGEEWSEVTKDWDDERIYKFWHNVNVTMIYNAYCTWVDAMYDCNYAKPEEIKVNGERFTVENPLDPTSYFQLDERGKKIIAGRSMIFSESEMEYYGLKKSDLTEVERKILTVEENVYRKALNLLNYATFYDDTIAITLATMELFEFNAEFSQTRLIGEDFVLYPQGYELKAFTWDAYLRLILTNTTGIDDLQTDSNQSLYERIMQKTSITFGIMLILLDIMAVYVIPAFKMFFLMTLFLMSILMIVAGAVRLELNLTNVVWGSLLKPLLSFSGVCIGLAAFTSMFMYEGATGVTGSRIATIQMGDPTMVTIVFLVANAGAIWLYWKICKGTFKDLCKYGKAVFNSVGGALAGAASTLAAVAMSGSSKTKNSFRFLHSKTKINRSGGGGDGDGSDTAEHNPSGNGRDNINPERNASNNSGSTGGNDASAGVAAAGGAGLLAAEMAREKEAVEKDKKEEYENKIAEGKDKREGNTDKSGNTDSGKGTGKVGGNATSGSHASKPKQGSPQQSGRSESAPRNASKGDAQSRAEARKNFRVVKGGKSGQSTQPNQSAHPTPTRTERNVGGVNTRRRANGQQSTPNHSRRRSPQPQASVRAANSNSARRRTNINSARRRTNSNSARRRASNRNVRQQRYNSARTRTRGGGRRN